MEATVLTAAIVLVAAAIIGGGLKAFNIEVPLLESPVRQVALLGFGGFLFFLALVVLPENDDNGPTTTTVAGGPTTSASPTTSAGGGTETTAGAELDEASGVGQVAHCVDLTVVVGPVTLEDNQLWVHIRLKNGAGNDPIQIPPDDLVTLTDEGSTQYALATFAQLSNGRWPLGQRIPSGATFEGLVIYERSGSGETGTLLVAEIRNANEPLQTCSVTVDGFGLP